MVGETGALAPEPIHAPERAPRADHVGPGRRAGLVSPGRRQHGPGSLSADDREHRSEDSREVVPFVPFPQEKKWHSCSGVVHPCSGGDFRRFRRVQELYIYNFSLKIWHTVDPFVSGGFGPLSGLCAICATFSELCSRTRTPAHAQILSLKKSGTNGTAWFRAPFSLIFQQKRPCHFCGQKWHGRSGRGREPGGNPLCLPGFRVMCHVFRKVAQLRDEQGLRSVAGGPESPALVYGDV